MTYDAFWVPGLDDDIDQADSLAVAFEWLADEELRRGSPGVIAMFAVKMVSNDPAITHAASRWDLVSPRSHRPGRGRGPVLCIWPPDDRTLEFAEGLAQGSALCVIPGLLMSIGSWIRRAQATCLLDGFEAEPIASVPPDIGRTLDGMLFFGGHNGFLGGGEKEDAVRRMREFARRPDAPTRDQLEDYLRGSGKTSGDGAGRAGEWYERIREGRSMRDYRGRRI